MQLFLPEFDKLIENQKDSCIIIGDFNLDLLKGSQYINVCKIVIEMNAFKIQNTISHKNNHKYYVNT